VTIDLVTHESNGITERDVALAQIISELAKITGITPPWFTRRGR
jgi:pterin-4a-carbinolamine dehydratase